MGARNPDRIPWFMFAASVETVGQMIDKRWRVRAVCARCQLTMLVNLVDLAQLRGRSFSLWDKHPQCRRLHCYGRVTFFAQAPRREPFWEPVERLDRLIKNAPAVAGESK